MGGRFVNMQELQVMTYYEAINGPEGKHWKAEVENKYQQMVKSKVFETVLKPDLPPGTKIIDSVWAMKKKSNGTLCGRINSRGFKQVEEQHYNGMTISDADVFTKNLDGPALEKCIKTLVGQDVYMKNPATSEEGECQEVSGGTQKSTRKF